MMLAPLITIIVVIPFIFYMERRVDRILKEHNIQQMRRQFVEMQALNDRLLREVGQLKQRVKQLEEQSH